MMRAKFCLAADGMSRDADTNSLSIFNIFENLEVEGFPVLVPRLVVVTVWERDEGDPAHHNCTVTIRLGDAPLLEQVVTIDFRASRRNRTVFRVGGLVVPHPGILTFTMVLGDGTTASYSVEIRGRVAVVQEQVPPAAEATGEPVPRDA